MDTRGFNLAWIVVADIKQAINFYTKTLGLTLHEFDEKYAWAELSGPEGAILAITQENPEFNMKAGTNAVVTITVTDIQQARDELSKKGAKLVGDIMEVPGEVKLQTLMDADGNLLQLAQKLR